MGQLSINWQDSYPKTVTRLHVYKQISTLINTYNVTATRFVITVYSHMILTGLNN